MSTPPAPPRFEPITDLNGYAFVFAQKSNEGMPVLWMDPYANPYAVVRMLRLIANQVEIAANEEPDYPPEQRRRDRLTAHAVDDSEVYRGGGLGAVPEALRGGGGRPVRKPGRGGSRSGPR
jgi:hypothetical protein